MIIGLDLTKLRRTERRLFELLSDGRLHSYQELIADCIEDDMSSIDNLRVHMCSLRKKLQDRGLVVSTVFNGQVRGYQMSRRIHKFNDD